MTSQIYLPPIMLLLQLILSPSQEQQIAVEYGPNTFISRTRGGSMMLKRWDDTTYNGTYTHTDKHTHMHNKKQQDAIAVILGQEHTYFRRYLFLLALDFWPPTQTNRTLLEQHTTKQDKYDKYATCACAHQLLEATCHWWPNIIFRNKFTEI